MRGVVFGLALIPLVVCSSVSAGDAQPSTESDGSQTVQKLPSPSQGRSAKNNKQISKSQSRPAPSSLPLSSAEAYAAEHSANLPVSSPPRTETPAANSWTGFYVGAGGGIGAARQ
jgi:hypothetical protein